MNDLTLFKKELQEIKAEIYQQPLAEFIPQIKKGASILAAIEKVDNQQSLEAANEWLQKAKTLQSFIVKKVEELCRPLKDVKAEADEIQRRIKSYADEIHQPLGAASMELQKKIIAYHDVLKAEAERARKVHEEMVREQLEKARKEEEARKKAEENGEEIQAMEPVAPPTIVVQPVIQPPKVKGLTVIWKYEITDPDAIPRTYLAPDLAKINAAVKGGLREIPGVRIFSEQQIKKS